MGGGEETTISMLIACNNAPNRVDSFEPFSSHLKKMAVRSRSRQDRLDDTKLIANWLDIINAAI